MLDEKLFCSADGTYKLGDFGITVRKGQSYNITTSGGTINALAPALAAVIVKACHRDRSEKYASAEEFYETLSNL